MPRDSRSNIIIAPPDDNRLEFLARPKTPATLLSHSVARLPGIELGAVRQRAGVVHGQHVAALRLGRAAVRNADHVHLQAAVAARRYRKAHQN